MSRIVNSTVMRHNEGVSKNDVHFLKMAARLALRGHGRAEPNPLVGCVIVSPRRGGAGKVVGWGYHAKYGEAHAEINALSRAVAHARGATMYCTLEPCDHQGKTGPCTKAIISAGVKRVVIARRDPNVTAAGGVERLRAAGIEVELNEECAEVIAVSEPFVHRIRTGLPWVTVKWAQTIDGKIATRPPHSDSKWISNEASRKMVHRERGRVDAVLTGIGTVLADDPMLTARGVRVRRIAKRIVIDPRLRIPVDSKLVKGAREVSTVVACDSMLLERETASELRRHGVEIAGFPAREGCLCLATVLRSLSERHNLAHVLVEAGTGLMSRLFQQGLVNEAWVFIAPRILGDEQATPGVTGMTANKLLESTGLQLLSSRRRGNDTILSYRID